MEGLTTYTLGELSINGKGSYGIGAPSVAFSENKYMYLRITDINDDGTLSSSDRKSVDDPDAHKYVLQKNDIVFARTGNSTGRAYFYDERDGELVYAGFLIKFSLDPAKVNPKILKYYTHSKPYYDWVKSFDTGATRGNINAQTFASMPIELPDRETQDRIVDILSAIDNKIRLNNRINHNLEEQIESLFNELCIDKEGYTEASLTEIADYINGLAMQKFPVSEGEKGLPVLKIKELGQGFCDESSDRCTSELKPDSIIHDGDIVFSWSGTLMVDMWCGGTCGLNQHLFKVQSNKYPKWFYYMWTKHHLKNFIHIAKDKAVTMGHIKRGHLENAIVHIPSFEVLGTLDKVFGPILEQILKTRLENCKLCEERDSLLPRLLTGEIIC